MTVNCVQVELYRLCQRRPQDPYQGFTKLLVSAEVPLRPTPHTGCLLQLTGVLRR